MQFAIRIAEAVCVAAALAYAAGAAAQETPGRGRLPEASARLQEYLRIDTTNPPGNEMEGARFFAEIFDREGLAWEIVEPAPGRGNIVARLPGGAAPAVILLHHIDVVPADPRFWTHPPLSGAYEDGYLHGRGTLDTKGLGIIHLQAFLELARSGQRLDRDVVFLATADEEAGGRFGVGWIVRNRPDLIENTGLVLNEGGNGRIIGNRVAFSVEVTQKAPMWLRLTATGPAGHGSSPPVRSAATDLIEALERLRQRPFPARIVPAVGDFFRELAELEPAASHLADPEGLIADPDRLAALHRTNPTLHALTRNTCTLTRLDASSKINVLAPTATAELDCRLLPDQDRRAFLRDLRTTLGRSSIDVDVLLSFTASESPVDTSFYRAIETVTARRFPGSVVQPAVTAGFTDSHFFRDLGIVAYGFSPVVIPNSDSGGVHGNDERISVRNIERGWRTMLDLLRAIASTQSPPESGFPALTPTTGGQN